MPQRIHSLSFFFVAKATPSPQWARASSLTRFLDHTHNEAPQSVGLLWTSDQPHRIDLYLTTHNTHNRQISMPPVGFKPTDPTSEHSHTYALDRAATGTGSFSIPTIPLFINYHNVRLHKIYDINVGVMWITKIFTCVTALTVICAVTAKLSVSPYDIRWF